MWWAVSTSWSLLLNCTYIGMQTWRIIYCMVQMSCAHFWIYIYIYIFKCSIQKKIFMGNEWYLFFWPYGFPWETTLGVYRLLHKLHCLIKSVSKKSTFIIDALLGDDAIYMFYSKINLLLWHKRTVWSYYFIQVILGKSERFKLQLLLHPFKNLHRKKCWTLDFLHFDFHLSQQLKLYDLINLLL